MSSTTHPLRVARDARGWTRADLAHFAQVTERTIASIELTDHAPNRATAMCLAHALGAVPTELFPGVFPTSPNQPAALAA